MRGFPHRLKAKVRSKESRSRYVGPRRGGTCRSCDMGKRLLVTEDKRPARSVRNLVSIELKEAN
jgi:hypothetical protein